MTEKETDYFALDEEGDIFKLTIKNRFCGCQVPGCVDDEITITEPESMGGESFTMQVPRLMSGHIEAFISGEYEKLNK